MTHKDIYTKFMIEYDKANVTSSYPSLTEYEVATVLDKAYNALIAQKVTGNNIRRAPFEADTKAISDLQPLVKTKNKVVFDQTEDNIIPNVMSVSLDKDCLYFLTAYLEYSTKYTSRYRKIGDYYCDYDSLNSGLSDPGHIYASNVFRLPTSSTDNENEDDFILKYTGTDTTFRYCTVYEYQTENGLDENAGYVRTGTIDDVNKARFVSDIQGYKHIFVWLDNKRADNNDHFSLYEKVRRDTDKNPYDKEEKRMVLTKQVTHEMASKFFSSASNMPWIKDPVTYVEDNTLYVVYDLIDSPSNVGSITYIKKPNVFAKDLSSINNQYDITYFQVDKNEDDSIKSLYKFECNDTVAEELISLAIAFALENVESQRLNSKLNMRGLEA